MCFHRQVCQVAINYFDRFYFGVQDIHEDMHQAIGGVCLFIAGKSEGDIRDVSDYLSVIYVDLTKAQFYAIERAIVNVCSCFIHLIM